jgi:hypothetical protein
LSISGGHDATKRQNGGAHGGKRRAMADNGLTAKCAIYGDMERKMTETRRLDALRALLAHVEAGNG